MKSNELLYSGYVAIVGRPNVGKSTLLNHILGQKISITSRKPQTTRHRIIGVKTLLNRQTIYVDTPGMHSVEPHAINREMNRAAKNALKDVDVVVFMVDGLYWTEEDEMVFKLVTKMSCPVILVINKVDKIKEKERLLPYLEKLQERFEFAHIIPIAAKLSKNVSLLENKIADFLPEGPQYFPEEQITDRPIRFRIAEIIREKLIRALGQELPYATSVEIETMKEEPKIYSINALIWVERVGQKAIVIGEGGKRLKDIGIKARQEIEALLNKKVHLRLWVKIKENWSDDERALKNLGYFDAD
jgi:GTP-binding protein Era